ncbi:MAG TPA: SHOCT domain-containing protein [Rudaea sp.]|nr:SHOCT domain-containing protein [Rudaea sp.]
MKRLGLVVLAMGALAGCVSNPSVVQTAPGVYYISREDKGGIFGNASAMKADVIREANEFAAKQGMVAIALSTHETPMYPMHFATFDYQFRLVRPDSPEAKASGMLVPTPNVREKIDVHHDAAPEKRDVYDELAKLDELHKKGVLTDAEFEAQKKKLLGEN